MIFKNVKKKLLMFLITSDVFVLNRLTTLQYVMKIHLKHEHESSRWFRGTMPYYRVCGLPNIIQARSPDRSVFYLFQI